MEKKYEGLESTSNQELQPNRYLSSQKEYLKSDSNFPNSIYPVYHVSGAYH